MLKCWEEEPNDRPTFQNLRKTMKEMERKHKVRWLGNMIKVVLHLQEKIDCFATYQSQYSYITNITRNTYLAITVAKLRLVTALKLSPVGRG